jgi:hypothetical protein
MAEELLLRPSGLLCDLRKECPRTGSLPDVDPMLAKLEFIDSADFSNWREDRNLDLQILHLIFLDRLEPVILSRRRDRHLLHDLVQQLTGIEPADVP